MDGPWARYVRDLDARGIGPSRYAVTGPERAEATKLAKRTLTASTASGRTGWRPAHRKLDAAVLEAYG